MKPSKKIVMALSLGALALAGCSSPSGTNDTTGNTMNTIENKPTVGRPNYVASKWVISDKAFAKHVAVLAVNTVTTPAGLLQVQLQVLNKTTSLQAFLYSFNWLDSQGMQVKNIVSANLPEQLEGGETKYISGIAPTPDCKDFRVKFISGNSN